MGSRKPDALRTEHCEICGEYPGVGAFCASCGSLMSHPGAGDYAAPYLRRLGCELLDLLLFLLLPIWLYMMWFTSRDGQSPAKRLLNLYVVSETGQAVTPQRMWMRELVIKRLLLGLIGYAFGLLGPVINAGWILLNPDRQCVHDRMVGTLVIVRREAGRPVARAAERDRPDRSGGRDARMPPPAPRGPRTTPLPAPASPPAARLSAPAPSAQDAAAASRQAAELAELERQRPTMSQTEYERRRLAIRRRLDEPR